ncbi:Aliphatic sulfonates import ATP-binding protein SsuB [compost metagenome]
MSFNEQIVEVRRHYNSGDFDLAHRRLLDCVIETADTTLFKQALSYCEWYEQSIASVAKDEISTKAVELLTLIEKIGPLDSSTNQKELLTVKSLSKQYAKSNFELNDIDFTLSAGEVIGLVGENGNGKTTLLRLLAAELYPDSGLINYSFANNVHDYELRSKLVYVPQRIPRWWGSLMDNLNFTLTQQGIKGSDNLLWAEMIVARLGLRPFRHLSWNRLSSGYRTRFELAKTLLRAPKVLLLDEPLANLDINAQQTVLQDLKFLSRSASRPFGILLSSQHIYEVEKVSDKIIYLEHGKPKYQQLNGQKIDEESKPVYELIIELETPATRESVEKTFRDLSPNHLKYNGNVYIVSFSPEQTMGAVLQSIAQHQLEIIYLRNISQSSRRFFTN